MRNQGKCFLQNSAQKSEYYPISNSHNKQTVKKNIYKDQVIKKSSSQIFNLPFMNTLEKKNKCQKENMDFRSIVKNKRESEIYNENRP